MHYSNVNNTSTLTSTVLHGGETHWDIYPSRPVPPRSQMKKKPIPIGAETTGGLSFVILKWGIKMTMAYWLGLRLDLASVEVMSQVMRLRRKHEQCHPSAGIALQTITKLIYLRIICELYAFYIFFLETNTKNKLMFLNS